MRPPVPLPFFSCTGFSVTLDGKQILRDLSVSLAQGDRIGLIGPNGSGKTTFLRTLARLVPFVGDAMLLGKPLEAWSAQSLARSLAFLRQTQDIAFAFSVAEIVQLGRLPHQSWLGSASSVDAERVAWALDQVDLHAFADRPFRTLSGGERQRALLAQALAQDAQVLLLDEPTNHLDLHHRYTFLDSIDGLVEAGRTTITAFHDLDLAARFCDHLLVFQDGRIVASGAPVDVLHRDLFADVFRMHVDVSPTPPLQFIYHGPV